MHQEGIYRSQGDRERVRLWSVSWQVDEDCVCGNTMKQGKGEPRTGMLTFVLFVLDSPFLDLDKLVPLLCAFLIQEGLWYPRQEICRIHCLLQAVMRYVWRSQGHVHA